VVAHGLLEFLGGPRVLVPGRVLRHDVRSFQAGMDRLAAKRTLPILG
jgi:hypothetical protein